MKITLELSEENEATGAPWWAVVDPCQNMRASLAHAAGQITGPFFSRAAGEAYLKRRHYDYSKRAAVWCFSGNWSPQYREACEAAQGADKIMAGGEMLEKVLERVVIESPVHGPIVAAALRRLLGEKMKREHDIEMALRGTPKT